MNLNTLDWLIEAEQPVAMQAPAEQPGVPPDGRQPLPEDDVNQDPQLPDIEDEEITKKKKKSFDQWKHEFMELSIKSDVGEMLDSIGLIRDRKLEPYNRKFVEDNLQILLYRQDDNAKTACKTIRNLIKEDLDRTNPGTTLMQHITSVLEKDVVLQEILIKLSGLYAFKAEAHRKFLAGLLGCVQVGGGGAKPDLLYAGADYTINISTRFATQFDEINLGKWTLKADDADRYLTDSEMDDLKEGSPDLRQALRRKLIMESIAKKFEERTFLIHVCYSDGTVYSLGWDLGDCLLAAYKEGKIIVRGKESEEKDAMISSAGDIVKLVDVEILYVRESGEMDDEGNPEQIEVPFMERRDSILYLNADLETIQSASAALPGMFFREMPFNGNPSELAEIRQCVPTITELLTRRCFQK